MPDLSFESLTSAAVLLIDLAGVVLIAGGLLLVVLFTVPALRTDDAESVYATLRRRMGKAILLGLEVLIAADIIRTVAISPSLENVAGLGLIVLIRTFLSVSLEVEIYGRWPWQRSREGASRVER